MDRDIEDSPLCKHLIPSILWASGHQNQGQGLEGGREGEREAGFYLNEPWEEDPQTADAKTPAAVTGSLRSQWGW